MGSELIERKPVKRAHGQVVGMAIVDGKLLYEIVQRIEGMAGIEYFSAFQQETDPFYA